MKIPDVSGVLSELYTDRMEVWRYGKETDEDGAACIALLSEPVLRDMPCRISFRGHDAPTPTSDGNPTEIQPLLICAPEVPIQSGDFIRVSRKQRGRKRHTVYEGHIGLPNPYTNSQQALFVDRGTS